MELKINMENQPVCTIMYQEQEVCNINRKTGEVKIYDAAKLPFGICLEESDDLDDRVNNRANFEHWCATRVLTLDRAYAKEILNQYGLRQAISDADRADISIATKGLSLNDSYWIRPANAKNLTWENINLFANSLSESMIDVALSGTPTMTNSDLITPDISTGGVFPKAWRRTNDGFVLYKGEVNDSVRKEVEASQMLVEMGFPALLYKDAIYSGKSVAMCKCISNETLNLAHAVDVSIHAMNEDMTFDVFKSFWQESYDAMILADYLIGNTDRHQENWGFYYTAPEREIIGLYPLMDFNHAFEANELTLCLPEKLCGRTVTQEDAAYEVYKKYGQNLKYNLNIDFSKYHYGSYAEQRVRTLEQKHEGDKNSDLISQNVNKLSPRCLKR